MDWCHSLRTKVNLCTYNLLSPNWTPFSSHFSFPPHTHTHTHAEVLIRRSAAGHLTAAQCEVVNLAPFATSFSTRLMAFWQLYGSCALWVVMKRNYIEPNLMNQPSVLLALPTLLACHHFFPPYTWVKKGSFIIPDETLWTFAAFFFFLQPVQRKVS